MPLLTLSPVGYQTIEDANGASINGGQVRTRLAGLVTLATTYQDSDGGTPNDNPIVADTAGRFVAFLTPGVAYDFDYMDADGSIFRTVEGILAVPASAVNLDVDGIAGENLAVNDVVYLSDGSGSKAAGQWFKADADNRYSSTTPIVGMVPFAIAQSATGTVRLAGRLDGLSGLVVGSTYYVSATAGALTATAPTNARVVGVADATDAIVMVPNPAIATTLNTDVLGVAGETLTAGQVAYLSDGSGALTAGRWYKADADLVYGSVTPILGWVIATIASGSSGLFRTNGRVDTTGVTAGTTYYVSGTAGAITSTAPSSRRVVGVADSTTAIVLSANPPPPTVVEFNAGNVGTTITIDFSLNGPMQRATRNANTTITLTFPATDGTFILVLVHEASATTYTVAFSPTVKFPGGVAPTWTNTSGAIDVITFVRRNSEILAVQIPAFS